jgi:hypothetical protein
MILIPLSIEKCQHPPIWPPALPINLTYLDTSLETVLYKLLTLWLVSYFTVTHFIQLQIISKYPKFGYSILWRLQRSQVPYSSGM